MAQARAERARSSSPPPPPAPPGETETGTNGAAAAVNGAAPPKTPEELDPFLFMRNFSTDEWKLLTAYLYRTAPIINKRGGEVNIQVHAQPFDQGDVMKTHGSGDYRVDLVQDKAEGAGRRRLRQFYFSIFNPEYPPKIPLTEWVDDPRNEKWAWAKQSVGASGITGTSTPMNVEGVFRMAMDFIERNKPNVSKEDQANLASKIVTMVENNQKQLMDLASPSKQLETLKTLADAIAPKKDDTFVNMLLEDRKAAREEAAESRKAQREEAAEFRKLLVDRPKEKGFLEQLIESEGALSKVKSLFGGGGSSKTDWGQVAMDLGGKIVEGLAPIGAALIYRAQNPNGAPGAQPGAASWPPAGTTRKTAAQIPARQTIDHQPAETAAGAAATEPAAATEEQMPPQPEGVTLSAAEQAKLMASLAKFGTLIQQCIPFLVDQYRAGLTGYDFRDWFISRHGMNWWGSMKNELKAEGLLLAARYDPALWEALQPEDKALAFFEQMFTDQGEEDLPPSEFENGAEAG